MTWRKKLVCVVLLSVLLLFLLAMKLQFGYTIEGDTSDSKHSMESDASESKHTVEGDTGDSKHTTESDAIHSIHPMEGTTSVSKHTTESDSNHTVEGDTSDSKRAQPRFVYAVQTESCLPIHLQKALGNPHECNCDVLVLSYKQSCKDVILHHVKYIKGYSLSWAEGRNLLLRVAKSYHTQYLYYIFMDDDIVLTSTKSGNPWRQFETFLINIEPAVAAVEIDTHQIFPRIKKAIEYHKCVVDDKSEYITTARIDTAFNAFHYQALDYLLPYSTNHINESWWYSGVHFGIKCEVTFRGHIVLHTQIMGHNPSHRPYPRRMLQKKDVLIILPEVAEEIPVKYRNNSVFLGWQRDGIEHSSLSSTYCLPPPPPHMPIKAFALLEAPIPG